MAKEAEESMAVMRRSQCTQPTGKLRMDVAVAQLTFRSRQVVIIVA